MPMLILGVILLLSVLGYVYISNNKDRFIRKKEDEPSPNDPFNVIYLPADLEKAKAEAATYAGDSTDAEAVTDMEDVNEEEAADQRPEEDTTN